MKGLKSPFTCFALWRKRDSSLTTEYPFTKYNLFVAVINSYDSLSVETGSGDISLTHETMPDNLSCHISSGLDDVTVQIKNSPPYSLSHLHQVTGRRGRTVTVHIGHGTCLCSCRGMREVTAAKANIDYLLGYVEPGRKKEQER